MRIRWKWTNISSCIVRWLYHSWQFWGATYFIKPSPARDVWWVKTGSIDIYHHLRSAYEKHVIDHLYHCLGCCLDWHLPSPRTFIVYRPYLLICWDALICYKLTNDWQWWWKGCLSTWVVTVSIWNIEWIYNKKAIMRNFVYRHVVNNNICPRWEDKINKKYKVFPTIDST